MEAELQAVLNTLTEHDFQDPFENGRSAGNGANSRRGPTSRVLVVGPKLVLTRWQHQSQKLWMALFSMLICKEQEMLYTEQSIS
jgi:hypothetical protein